jgi:hypothetical protein
LDDSAVGISIVANKLILKLTNSGLQNVLGTFAG